jgi:hypothetical protein
LICVEPLPVERELDAIVKLLRASGVDERPVSFARLTEGMVLAEVDPSEFEDEEDPDTETEPWPLSPELVAFVRDAEYETENSNLNEQIGSESESDT